MLVELAQVKEKIKDSLSYLSSSIDSSKHNGCTISLMALGKANYLYSVLSGAFVIFPQHGYYRDFPFAFSIPSTSL